MQQAAATGLSELQKKVAPVDLDEAVKLRNLSRDILARSSAPPSREETGAEAGKAKKVDSSNEDLPNAERKQLLARISGLEKQLGQQSELAKLIVGTSYRIQFPNNLRVWTFAPNGVLLLNGEATATRWSAFGNDAIICAGYDNGFIDICQFSNGFQNIEVIFVGNYKRSVTRHLETRATQ